MLLLPLEVFLVESVDSINHDLDQLNLRVSKTMLVGDVISAAYNNHEINMISYAFLEAYQFGHQILHGYHGAGQQVPHSEP